ncbi:hypothetical protein T05_7316 [Trichinella murrelli]|uniref:Uncharacterized protein n=1 Tax=Trichinella murrelli TaxID=144512 RepID=A0A0V0TKT2_9BILA|nr:hypothetical protein T05_7316 [Trichinella murrelli]
MTTPTNSVLYKKKHLNASVLWIYADYSKNLHQWNKFLLWLKKSSTMTNVVGILSDVEGVFYYDLCSICSTYFSKKKKVNGSSSLTGKYRKHAIREIPEIIREFFSSCGLSFVKFVKQIALLYRARYSAHFDTKLSSISCLAEKFNKIDVINLLISLYLEVLGLTSQCSQ